MMQPKKPPQQRKLLHRIRTHKNNRTDCTKSVQSVSASDIHRIIALRKNENHDIAGDN